MASYLVAVILKRRRRRRELSKRLIKDLESPFSMEEYEFTEKYCMNQKAVLYLCELLGPILKKSSGYPVEFEVLTSLQLLRTGNFQSDIIQDKIGRVSQSYVSRGMDQFLDAIMEIEHQIIEFPSFGELAFTEPKFYGQSKILNINGALLCTHVKIFRPSVTNHSLYLNIKNEYSIKVQLVCDPDLYILDAVVEWPGSTPDYIIWRKSPLRNILKNNTMPNKGFLVGDSNFPLEPWLLVPYEDCQKTEELIFNDHIDRALRRVQTCDAVVRTRFKCLNHNYRQLHYSPDKCCKMIFACFVLHNICLKLGLPLNEPIDLKGNVYIPHEIYSDDNSDMEETLLRNEASYIRDEVAKQLLKI